MNNNNNKAGIIYVRVSSEEQVAGTSLDYQEEQCRKYCENHDIKIIKIFREEGASAKSAERKEFIRAIEFCRQRNKRNGIDSFVVHKIDRFARNVEDHYSIRRRLLDYGTQLHSVSEPIDDSPQGKVFEAMLSAFAEFDNSIRRQRCMDGMSARINEGIYPWKPPIGYEPQYTKREGRKKDKPDEPHPDIFPILQKGLRKFSKGHYVQISHFIKDLNVWGLESLRGKKISSQLANNILNKHLSFYVGLLHNPFTSKTVKGGHKPMITEEEYKNIKFHLRKKRVQPETNTVFREDFALRQFVHCSLCGNGLTGSSSKGRNKRYPYYHCYNSKCEEYGKTTSATKLENSFEDVLRFITPTNNFWKSFKKDALSEWGNQRSEFEGEIMLCTKRIEKLNKRFARLKDAYLDGDFEAEYYRSEKEKITHETREEERKKKELNYEEIDMELLLGLAKDYSDSILNLWKDLIRPEQRRVFLKFVFSGKVLYHRKDGSWNHPLSEIFSIYKAYTENGASEKQKSTLVPLRLARWNHFVDNLRILDMGTLNKSIEKKSA